jgi:hypothetical protein
MGMPVTARLSKRFYEALGEDVANELVDWFNSVDATYKADLRDLIEVQAQRFDAKLQQGMAELRTEMANLRAELVKWMFLFWLGTVGVTLAGVLLR